MLKLILKDFAVQKNSFKTYVFIALFLGIFFSLNGQQQMAIPMISMPIIFGFINRALYEDERNNTLRLLVSLPIRKEILVYARYITAAIVSIGTFVFFMLVNYLFVLSGVWEEETGIDAAAALAIVLVFIILLSIYLPLAYKLGYIKAANINRFIFIGIFGLSTVAALALKKISENSPPPFISRIEGILSSASPYTIMILAIAFTIAVYFISMELSIKFFKKRNLF